MEQKRVLVCGGAGFLGSHLCERLVKEGNEVICVDNLSTGSADNIRDLLDNKKSFHFIQHDISEPLQDCEVDEIYNLACPESPDFFQKNPLETFKTCTHGSYNLLDMAERMGSKILLASACGVYGNSESYPQTERDYGALNPVSTKACYNEGKRCAETMFMVFNKLYNLPVKIARIFNTYGPRTGLQSGHVVENFVVRALCNKSLIVYGDGTQTRSFCYVDDMVDGVMAMMESSGEFTGPANLGNPEEYSIKELARLVIKLTNSKSSIIYKPYPGSSPARRKPSIDVAVGELQWWPRIPFREGIMKTIFHFDWVLRKKSNKSFLNDRPNRLNAYAGVV